MYSVKPCDISTYESWSVFIMGPDLRRLKQLQRDRYAVSQMAPARAMVWASLLPGVLGLSAGSWRKTSSAQREFADVGSVGYKSGGLLGAPQLHRTLQVSVTTSVGALLSVPFPVIAGFATTV